MRMSSMHKYDTSTSKRFFVKYCPTMIQYFGKYQTAIVFERLEYWSSRQKEGFWKFYEPCSHPLWREGDSWQEELGFSRRLFHQLFTLIGTRYKSKSAFLKAADPFQGKCYASYYDRKTNRTYFLRNHAFVENLLKSLWETAKTVATKTETSFKKMCRSWNDTNGQSFTRARNIYSSKVTSSQEKEEEKKNEKKIFDSDGIIIVAQEMIKIWNQTTGNQDTGSPQLNRRLHKALIQTFESSLDHWRGYCQKIASSKFLMGEGKNSTFKALLGWVIMPETVVKVIGDVYSSGDRRLLTPLNPKMPSNHQIKTLDHRIESIDRQVEHLKNQVKREQQQVIQAHEKGLSPVEIVELKQRFATHYSTSQDSFGKMFQDTGWNTLGCQTMLSIFIEDKIREALNLPAEETAIKQAIQSSKLLEQRDALMQTKRHLQDALNHQQTHFKTFVENIKRYAKPYFDRSTTV